MPFLNDPPLRNLGASQWELTEPLVYQGARDRFEVPAGYVTDLASVPRIFWTIFPPFGSFTKAAILHDRCYSHAKCVYVTPRRPDMHGHASRPISRREADGLFRRTMRELGTSFPRRWTMWAAVRLFGWIPWHRARRAGR